jgi:hypothetical protein
LTTISDYEKKNMPFSRSWNILSAAVGIMACSFYLLAYEVPSIPFTSSEFLAWRNSVRLTIYADQSGPLVEFTGLISKPAAKDIYWAMHLEAYNGTNLISKSDLGYTILDPAYSSQLQDTNLTNKTIQRFVFSMSPSLITNSIITFSQCTTSFSGDVFFRAAFTRNVVRLSDLYFSATILKTSKNNGSNK